MSVAYLDASALVKLVRAEPESEALRTFLGEAPEHSTSVVSSIEVLRAAKRVGVVDELRTRAEAVIASTALIGLGDAVVRAAQGIDPPTIRTLDAIHLASALALGDDLDVFVCYDRRLADAAEATGLTVLAPA